MLLPMQISILLSFGHLIVKCESFKFTQNTLLDIEMALPRKSEGLGTRVMWSTCIVIHRGITSFNLLPCTAVR